MRRIAVLGVMLACASAAAQEQDGPDYLISCKATHEVSCIGPRCDVGDEQDLPVVLSISSRSGAGELCTYTYCRSFMLMPEPGEEISSAVARLTGFTLSESRGSTEEHIGRPSIDFQLSVSPDHATFTLFGAGGGGMSGWAGACEREIDDGSE
ncbi:MAG: hypothetical protein R3C46_10750 [Hyphomonadaceae bacterium]